MEVKSSQHSIEVKPESNINTPVFTQEAIESKEEVVNPSVSTEVLPAISIQSEDDHIKTPQQEPLELEISEMSEAVEDYIDKPNHL